jgi:hypothetical protein
MEVPVRFMDFETFLKSKLDDRKSKPIIGRIVDGDDLAIAGLTYSDLLYDVIRIDPTVIEAIDFSRAADLSTLPEFSTFASEIMSKSGRSFDGSVDQMKGYVAERYVAETIRRQGAEVEFPETSNQAGYDLLVNGDPFQVKCWETVKGVEDHLAKYPDIPVFVNEELAIHYQGNEMVYPVWGVRHDQVELDTIEALDAGAEIGDFEIPIITAAVVAANNVYGLIKKSTDFRSALKNTVEGTTARSVGSAGGAALSVLTMSAIGITGGWATIIIPLMGSIAGQGMLSRFHKFYIAKYRHTSERAELKSALEAYLVALSNKLSWMTAKGDRQRKNMNSSLEDTGNDGQFLSGEIDLRFADETGFRQVYAQKIEWAMNNDCLFADCPDLLSSTIEAVRIAGHVGVLPQNLRKEHRNLVETSMNYAREIAKAIV